MGGTHSTQLVSDQINSSSSVVQKLSMNCISYENANNELVVNGSGNVVGNITQTMHAVVDSACVGSSLSAQELSSEASDEVSQQMTTQQIALTGMLDASSQNIADSMTNNFNTVLNVTTSQNCVNSYNNSNITVVSGDANVVKNVTQSNTLDAVGKCLMTQSGSTDATTTNADTSNQYSSYVSSNPFSFITDAIKSMFSDGFAAIAAIIILIIVFIFVFIGFVYWLGHSAAVHL